MKPQHEAGTDERRSGQRFVKPSREGLLVSMPPPGPARRRLPPEGAWVAWDTYWARRLEKGDVVACDPPRESGASDERVKSAKKE
jgi:hypothetical protein